MSEGWQGAVEAHKARYRDRIIDAAVDLAATEGSARITMARLAEKAGIGRATLYKYFPDVEQALLAHVEREIDRCVEVLAEASALPAGTGLERLRTCIGALAGYFASRAHQVSWAGLDRAELSAAANSVVTMQMARLQQPVVEVFAAGVADGSIRAGLDPAVHGPMVFKLVVSLHDELRRGAMTGEQAADAVWQLAAHGIAVGERDAAAML
jgi:AcrR family transcriptional regulator